MPTLVTLGCSMTEGQGCWGNKTGKIVDEDLLAKERAKYKHRFYLYGWPHLVAQELGFKKLINLGTIGSSTSGQVKFFMEQEFEDEQIYVIWMLTEPMRFSFYKNGSIVNINPIKPSEIGDAYLNFVKSISLDASLEQLFYVKALRDICVGRNFKLLITYWSPASKLTQLLDSTSKNYLTPTPEPIFSTKLEHTSPVCNHPNELGHKYMYDKIISYINLYHKEYKVGAPTSNVKIYTPEYREFKVLGNFI